MAGFRVFIPQLERLRQSTRSLAATDIVPGFPQRAQNLGSSSVQLGQMKVFLQSKHNHSSTFTSQMVGLVMVSIGGF